MIGDPTKLVIKARFPRLTEAQLAPFRDRSTSFVVDAMNGRGALDHTIKPLDPKSRFVGSALTARAGARDNLAALAALDLIEPGDVLVVATQGFTGTATAWRQHGPDRQDAGRRRARHRRHGARCRRDHRARHALLLPRA